MAVSPKDFMSTQTGGTGETIQAQQLVASTPEQFSANIAPQVETSEPAVQVQQEPIPQGVTQDIPMDEPIMPDVPELSEEEKIYSDLGLKPLTISIPDYSNEITEVNQVTNPNKIYVDGVEVASDEDIKAQYQSILKAQEDSIGDMEDDSPESEKVFIPDYDAFSFESDKPSGVPTEYSQKGISIDSKGSVRIDEPKSYPLYKLPNKDIEYQKRPDGWYKKVNNEFIKLQKGDVAARERYLNNNAVLTSSKLGAGSREVSDAQKIIGARIGDVRGMSSRSILTGGGDAVLADDISFGSLTASKNQTGKHQRHNPDGTINFNYDPSYDPLNNDGTPKALGAEKIEKPKGKPSKPTNALTVEESVITNKLDPFSIPSIEDELASQNLKFNDVQFEDAKNFIDNNIGITVKDKLSGEQISGLASFQDELREIIGDGAYDVKKAAQAAEVMKNARQFFETSKEVNKDINKAYSEGVSLSRLAFENKKKNADAVFNSGKDSSAFQQDAKEMFEATSEMADFFIENLDAGKIRFDSESGEYVVSSMISDREKKYLQTKMGSYVDAYEKIQDEKYSQINDKISEYKRNFSNVKGNVERLEGAINSMREAGMKSSDPALVALTNQLAKEKQKGNFIESLIADSEKTKGAIFLTEPLTSAKNIASNMSTDAANIFKAIPGDITPKQKFDLFYERLQLENERLMKENNIGKDRFSGLNMALKDLLDWEGFYSLSDVEKKVAQNAATLRASAPIYFNNDTGITKSSDGFWNSLMNSLASTLFPTVSAASGWKNMTGMAQDQLEIIGKEGFEQTDFVDEKFIDKLEKRSINDEWNFEKWGDIVGPSVAMMASMMATAGIGPGALRLGKYAEGLIGKGLVNDKSAVNIINTAEKIYNKTLQSTKFGRFLSDPLDSAFKYEISGQVVGSTGDELYFLSGLAGGVASDALASVFAAMPKDKIISYLTNVFGAETDKVIAVAARIADMSAKGFAETGEEFAQEVSNIYRDTKNFKEMMAAVSEQFGDFDSVQEFVISSFVMGSAFGLADGKSGKKAYNALSGKKKEQVDQAVNAIRRDLSRAEEAVAEYSRNKNKQREVETKANEYDQKNKERVSGEVKEGQESIEGQPDVEAGKEEAGTDRVLQEEEVTVPTEEKVTANSKEEAVELWDQGYRVFVDGKELKGSRDFMIKNLFNTKKSIEMVRTITPEAKPQAESETTKPAAEAETIDVYHGGSMDEKTGALYVTEDKGQATEYAKGNDGDVSKYSIPKDKVATEEDVSAAISELGIEANEEAKVAELIDPRFEETYIGEENTKRLFDSLKEKGFDAASFTDEDLTLREKGGVSNIVVFDSENMSPSSVTVTENQAENLYDQGYRPVIDGNTQADYSKENIGDLFEQSERIEMALPAEVETQTTTQAETQTEAKGFEKLAEKIREFKLKPGDLTGGDSGVAMSSIGIKGFEKVWNAAVETIAQTIVVSGNSAEAIQKAIDAGFKSIKGSDWYKSLDRDQKKQVSIDYNEGVNKMFPKEKLSKEQREGMKDFKEKVAEVTGTAKPEKSVKMTELTALKESLKSEGKGYRAGKAELQAMKKQVADFAKEKLPKDDYTKKEVDSILNSLSNARTPAGVIKAIERIEGIADRKAEKKRKDTIKELDKRVSSKRTLFSKVGNKWVGKVSIDAQKEYLNFIESGALDNLDNKTQQELDAINDVIDGILGEGKSDLKAKRALEDKAKRTRAAQLIEGYAKGDFVELNGREEVEAWLDDGNVVVINGEMYRKNSLKEITNKLDKAKKEKDKLINRILSSTDENIKQELLIELEAELDKVAFLESQLTNVDTENEFTDEALSGMRSGSVKGYKQRSTQMVRDAENSRNKKKKLSRIAKNLNPIRSINDIYSLSKSAYAGSSKVAKFIRKNIETAIKDAYFNKMKAYHEKMKAHDSKLREIFGSKKSAIDRLSSRPETQANEIITDKAVAGSFNLTNGHLVDWYNLIRANENGFERMEKSQVVPEKVVSIIESDPELKAFADYLMEKYNTDLRAEYEPVFESYTNSSFGDGTYYPSYADGFDSNFVNESEVMGVDGMYNAMSSTSRNLKQRNNFSGKFDLRLDANGKYLDYIKTMEHAKNFMPVAKSANELFSMVNTPYIIEAMGVESFMEMKEHLGVILSDTPLKNIGGMFSFLNKIRPLNVVTTLGGNPSAIVKQFTSFTHYLVAGIDKGLDPIQVMTGVPKSAEELDVFRRLGLSEYTKERFSGQSIDLEIKKMMQDAEKNYGRDWANNAASWAMITTRLGDISVIFAPGGGASFGLASYRNYKKQGMSNEAAFDAAYKDFVTETEIAQQTVRPDITSMLQRDPMFRFMGMYRTGQMAVTKKIVNAAKTLYQASLIERAEGTGKALETFSDREIIQAIVDITYYSILGSTMFSAVAGGAIAAYGAATDDEKERIRYDLAMGQVQSLAQGFGVPGFFADWGINMARGNDWMNNIPTIKFITGFLSAAVDAYDYAGRDLEGLSKDKNRELFDEGKLPEAEDVATYYEAENQSNLLSQDFNSQIFWSKMTDDERDAMIKKLGAGNITRIVNNIGKYMDQTVGEGEEAVTIFDVIMNWDANYFEKVEDSKRKDRIYEMIHGEPYLIPEMKYKKVKNIFGEEPDNSFKEDLIEKIK